MKRCKRICALGRHAETFLLLSPKNEFHLSLTAGCTPSA